MFLLPVACIVLPVPGWLKFGIHLNAAFMSVTGSLGMLATPGALTIAFDVKRVPWSTPCGCSSHHTEFPSEWASCNGCPSVCTPNR